MIATTQFDQNFINDLKQFLFAANKKGYAGGDQNILPQRPAFNELEYQEGDWYFRDSYTGHFFAPGQEIVYFKDKPVWAMAYNGGMKKEWHKDSYFTKETIFFLKEALLEMDQDKPFRGPKNFRHDEWWYMSKIKGDITNFIGNEKIFNNNKLVFEQDFMGGTII